MPQTLSLPNSCVNPYTEVKITNKFLKDDGCLMCFGEFICPETNKYESTIVNGNTKETNLILEAIEPGTVVHTMPPLVNTKAKNKNYTKYRAFMRIINEQPIYIQEMYEYWHNRAYENKALAIPLGEAEKELKPEQKQEVAKETEKLPFRIGVAKTTLRYKYIDKLVADSPRSQSRRNLHAETVGDLVDYCIEHNINPYQNDT